MKKSDLAKMIQEAVQKALKENMGASLDDQLNDATELLMMVSGRIMSAKDVPGVQPELIAQAVHHIEQADGLLAKAGLKADGADISDLSEALKRIRGKKK